MDLAQVIIRAKDESGGAFGSFKGNVRSSEDLVNSFRRSLGALGIGVGAGYFVSIVKGAIDAQDQLAKLSQKVDISVEDLAGWGHALDLAGASQDALQKSAKSLASQMVDASFGLLESQRNFKVLNLEIRNSDGSLRSVNSLLLELADKYAMASDKTAILGLMTKLLGRSAQDMIPVFKDGRAALEAMIAEGKALNPVTAESARQAEAFNDDMRRLEKSLAAVGIRILNDVLPMMSELAAIFAEDALAGDMQKTADKARNLDNEFKPLAETLRALTMLGGNFVFTWSAVGKEIGGISAQFAALGRGDFKGFTLIHQEMMRDAESARAAFDAWERRVMAIGKPGMTAGVSNPWDAESNAIDVMPARPISIVNETDLANNKKLRDQDVKGWVAYAQAIFDAADEENLALAKISEDYWANEDRLRKLDNAGWIAFIEAQTQEYEDQLRAIAEINGATKDEITEFWKEAARSMQSSMSDLFFDVMQGNLSDLAGSFKKTIDRMVADMLAAKANTALFGEGFGKGDAPLGGIVGDIFKSGKSLLGFAGGGDFTVGGGGGTDSQVIAFRATPGERVTVQTPAQQKSGGRAMVININQHFDAGMTRASIQQAAVETGQRVQRALARNG